jgi:hypothetical protein
MSGSTPSTYFMRSSGSRKGIISAKSTT